MLTLMKHQADVLKESKDLNRVAYYYDMGLGKTFIGSEKAVSLHKNILVVCQKSKVDDWVEHFTKNYDVNVFDLTSKHCKREVIEVIMRNNYQSVFIINYDLIWRRPELANLTDFTLMLDESSLIQNDTSKRSKFIIRKLKPTNVILLSGTPVGGKYEKLISQIHLLGWNISKDLFQRHYCIYDYTTDGFPVIVGYKNVERLKRKLREYGCFFKTTNEVLDLPEQRFVNKVVKETKLYRSFMKDSIVEVDGKELVGDTTLNKMLYARQLSSAYNPGKIEALKDLIESTEDRLVIFYNFDIELEAIKSVIPDNRPISYINGKIKDKTAYENETNSITLCQYQSASMGHNLQLCNKLIYFSPPLSSELYEQSKKRIHRIGQDSNCIYYKLISGIEWNIYHTLDMRKDYTDELFKEVEDYGGE